MSYILDALRKSDQLRRRSGTPTLLQVPLEVATPKQPALLLYAVIALLLLGLGIAIGWWRPWQQEERVLPFAAGAQAKPELAAAAVAPAAVAPSVSQESPPAPAPSLTPPTAVPAPAVPALTPSPTGLETKRVPLQDAVVPAPSKPRPAAQREAVATQRAQPQQARSEPSAAAEAPAVIPLKLSELPIAIQQELPPLSISVHAYSSNARDRLVGINGRLLHESDVVAPGLKLEQITIDGMIFSYKGYTFRRGVN